jgi:hypothetical protein
MAKKGWANRELKRVASEAQTWPMWMQQSASAARAKSNGISRTRDSSNASFRTQRQH